MKTYCRQQVQNSGTAAKPGDKLGKQSETGCSIQEIKLLFCRLIKKNYD